MCVCLDGLCARMHATARTRTQKNAHAPRLVLCARAQRVSGINISRTCSVSGNALPGSGIGKFRAYSY